MIIPIIAKLPAYIVKIRDVAWMKAIRPQFGIESGLHGFHSVIAPA